MGPDEEVANPTTSLVDLSRLESQAVWGRCTRDGGTAGLSPPVSSKVHRDVVDNPLCLPILRSANSARLVVSARCEESRTDDFRVVCERSVPEVESNVATREDVSA